MKLTMNFLKILNERAEYIMCDLHIKGVYFKVSHRIDMDTCHAMCQLPKNIFQTIPLGMEYG